ncbi:MAG: 3-isopropylmalate dehydrogenase [Hyphomicrobiaceae bacterium]|nr:3-isopropylmalate dehydrogenase [Hyphomicrobiaceae bacterium]
MMTYNIILFPGDGIGPEVISQVERIIKFFNTRFNKAQFAIETELAGGAALDVHGVPITNAAIDKAQRADAILFGAVGDSKWDDISFELRPEAGLLRLRKDLDLFANLRPAICYPALATASSLQPSLVEGLDILIVRELTGGTYFSQPKEIVTLQNGQKRAVDTTSYTTFEISRIVKIAFNLAAKRYKKVHSVEKRNVMMTGVLWHEVISELHQTYAENIELKHILADSCVMQLVRQPKQFDVIVCDNLFGDILSDAAAMLTGSVGMLSSASLGTNISGIERPRALYEPVHGTAPDIANQDKANPIAAVASFAMALRYSFGLVREAELVEKSISNVLDQGYRTIDIMQDKMCKVGTNEMGQKIVKELETIANY